MNANQYAQNVIKALRNDPSINRAGTYDNGMTPARRAQVMARSKRTSLELAKETEWTTLKLQSIRHLEGYAVTVRLRNGKTVSGKLHFEAGQCVVRNGQYVMGNFHLTNKTRINTKTRKIIA